MNDRRNALLGQIRQLEKELSQESRKKETEFCYKVHGDAEKYRAHVEEIRRSFQEIELREKKNGGPP